MSKNKSVQKKALKKRADVTQGNSYKETLRSDFEFIMRLLVAGSERLTETGEIEVGDLIYVDTSPFSPSQKEIFQNFQKYVAIDKYATDEVANVEIIEAGVH